MSIYGLILQPLRMKSFHYHPGVVSGHKKTWTDDLPVSGYTSLDPIDRKF